MSPDVIAAHMQDIALEDKESGCDSSKDKDNNYIADKKNSDSVWTDGIPSTVENDDFFMEATLVKPTHSSRIFELPGHGRRLS